MMKKIAVYVSVLLSAVLLTSADLNCHKVNINDRLYIVNNSNKDVNWDYSYKYPDTNTIGRGGKA